MDFLTGFCFLFKNCKVNRLVFAFSLLWLGNYKLLFFVETVRNRAAVAVDDVEGAKKLRRGRKEVKA